MHGNAQTCQIELIDESTSRDSWNNSSISVVDVRKGLRRLFGVRNLFNQYTFTPAGLSDKRTDISLRAHENYPLNSIACRISCCC